MKKDSKTKKITKKDVKHIASLARIKLTEKEIKKFQKEFEAILSHFDKLGEVKTEGVTEISQVTGITNIMREDFAKEFLTQAHALQNAPKSKDGYIQVPSVLKKSE